MNDDSWRRCFEHRGALRERFIVGLQRNHSYLCRVRAYNAFGWSAWSQHSEVFVPGTCVWLEYEGEIKYIKWLEPKLTEQRKVTLYQILSYQLNGPLLTDYTSKKDSTQDEKSEHFTLLCSTERNYVAFDDFCQSNARYVFKVQFQINGVWTKDDANFVSEVIQANE